MFKHDLAIIDVETTGLSPLYHRIIEVGIIRISKNKIVDKFVSLVNPETALPPFISMFTGITDEDLVKAPYFGAIAPRVNEMLKDAVFVAHNARFDYSFIQAEMSRNSIDFFAETLCTMQLSRRLYPQHRRHSLQAVIDRFGFKCKRRHRAYDDALICWKFLKKSRRELLNFSAK